MGWMPPLLLRICIFLNFSTVKVRQLQAMESNIRTSPGMVAADGEEDRERSKKVENCVGVVLRYKIGV